MGKDPPLSLSLNTDTVCNLSPLGIQHAPEMRDDFGLLEIGYIACVYKSYYGVVHHPIEMKTVKFLVAKTRYTHFACIKPTLTVLYVISSHGPIMYSKGLHYPLVHKTACFHSPLVGEAKLPTHRATNQYVVLRVFKYPYERLGAYSTPQGTFKIRES